MVRTQGVSGQARCEFCHHQPAFCEDCHRDMEPRDHTTLFRTRTHGMVASDGPHPVPGLPPDGLLHPLSRVHGAAFAPRPVGARAQHALHLLPPARRRGTAPSATRACPLTTRRRRCRRGTTPRPTAAPVTTPVGPAGCRTSTTGRPARSATTDPRGSVRRRPTRPPPPRGAAASSILRVGRSARRGERLWCDARLAVRSPPRGEG